MQTLAMRWNPLIACSIGLAGAAAFMGAYFITIEPITTAGRFFMPAIFGIGFGYCMNSLKSKREISSKANTREIMVFFGFSLVIGFTYSFLASLLGASWFF